MPATLFLTRLFTELTVRVCCSGPQCAAPASANNPFKIRSEMELTRSTKRGYVFCPLRHPFLFHLLNFLKLHMAFF